MTTKTNKPRKPWRVTLTGPNLNETTEHTSEAKAYVLVNSSFLEAGRVSEARVDQWEGGRWWHFETVTAEEMATHWKFHGNPADTVQESS